MRGYKALNKDMKAIHGDDIQYELNKEYTLDSELRICRNGYHFCKELINVYKYYSYNSRVFEIDTLDGDIESDKGNIKYCSNRIKLVREVTKEEINKYIEDNLDKFVKYPDYDVRVAVAKHGYGLDNLIDDHDYDVRAAVASQGYGLDKLINDPNYIVKAAVARQGYGLDKLINDKDYHVRERAKRARTIKQLYENKEDK